MSFNSVTGILSGGLIDPKTPNYAGAANKAEQRRQALINAGLANINAVFGGGTTPFYSPVTDPYSKSEWKAGGLPSFYKPGKGGTFQQYTVPGTKNNGVSTDVGNLIFNYNPGGPGFLGGLFGGGSPSPRKQVNQQINKGNLFTAENKTFQGFQPDFYDKIARDYVAYALPQFADQYQSTRDAMQFGLQNRGLQGGSAWDKAFYDLDVQTGRGKQQISDAGRAMAQDYQKQVEAARQQAINQLYMTADPSQGLQSAVSSAAQFQVPQTFTPLTNMFTNLANQYAMRQMYNNYSPMQYTNPYGMGTDLGWMGRTIQ